MKVNHLLTLLVSLAVSAVQAQPLSLRDALDRALESDPRLESASAGIDEARARADEVRSGLLPRVDFEESITRGNHPGYAFGTRLTQERFRNEDLALDALNQPSAITDHQTRLVAEVPIIHVAGWLGARAARLQVGAARSQRAAVESQVMLETLSAYFGVQVTDRAAEVAAQEVEAARHDAARVRSLHDAGMATDVDALALEVAVASAEEKALEVRNRAALARATLNHALSLPLRSELTLTTELEGNPDNVGEADVSAHPLVRAAVSQRDAAEVRRRSAALRWLPVVTLYGDLQSHRSEFASNGGESWTVGVVFRLNLFRGLGDWSHARAAEAVSRRVSAALTQAEDAVRLEVERARLALETAGARVEITQRAVGLAREALQRERSRLNEGMSNVTALMHSRSARLTAELHHLSALYAQRMASASLAAALGNLNHAWEENR